MLKYSSALLKKKEIIVLNKIDLINPEEIDIKINILKKKLKKRIYKISVIKNIGLSTLKKILIKNVYK